MAVFCVVALWLTRIIFLASALYSSVCDVRQRILPNKTLGIMAVAALVALVLEASGLAINPSEQPLLFGSMAENHAGLSWTLSLWTMVGARVGIVAVVVVVWWLLEILFRKIWGHTAFGAGDIKLFAAWVLFAGFWSACCGLALGCLCGALVNALRKRSTFPLGPWISGCSTIFWLFSRLL